MLVAIMTNVECWSLERRTVGPRKKKVNLVQKKKKNYDEILNRRNIFYCKQIFSKRTKKIQWKIQTLHRDFSPRNPNRENQHILYSFIVIHCLQYNIHIGSNDIQNPNPMTWISQQP
jgi:hypothetical protein